MRTSRIRRGLPIAVAVWALLWTVGVGLTWAHAYLERATPTSNAILETAPRQVQVWFTEEPELRFSEVVVYDAQAQRVDAGNLRVAPGEPRSLIADLPELPEGPYTVSWKTLSTVDGHTARGAYTFAIGLGQQPGAPVLPEALSAEPGLQRAAPSATVRWLSYLATAILTGGVAFGWWVARPALGPTPDVERVLRRTLLASAVVVLLVGLVGLLLQVATVAGGGLGEVFGAPLAGLLATRYGFLWGARMALVLALGATLLPRGDGGRRPWLAPLQLALAAAILLTISLNSHAAALVNDTAAAVAVDWVHLVGTAVWVGGVILLTALVPTVLSRDKGERRPALGRLVSRFSPLALWSVVGLTLSGLYQALIHVGSVRALTDTPYGQSLLWKLALVIPMLGVGLVNAAWMRPRLAAKRPPGSRAPSEGRLGRWFGRTVALEAALGVAVLAVVGLLTTQEPAREALARMPQGFSAVRRVDDLQVGLGVTPAVAGLNTIEVRLEDGRGRPAEADRVPLRFDHTEHDMGENEAVAEPLGDGRYAVQGSFLSMVGRWQVAVLVRRADRDDLRAEFAVPTADPSLPADRRAGALSLGTNLVLGIALLVATVALLRRVPRRGSRVASPRAGGQRSPPRDLRGFARDFALPAATALAGAYLVWLGFTRDVTPTFALTNPVPPTRESLARGGEIYAQYCLVCHGPAGRGDGPLARTLNPRPADLRTHVAAHSEGQLYWWISKGFPGSAMPAFEEQLSEEDRWHVLNFIVETYGPNGRDP